MGVAVLWLLVGYLAGSVPVGLIVGRLAGKDIRRFGTGNIGASNVMRNLGLLPAAVVGVTSFVQGLLPAWAAGEITGSQLAVAAAAVGAVAGYGWSFLLAFHGGRAVGTATGALAAISLPGLIPLIGGYAVGGLLRQPAPGVLVGLIAYLVYLALWPQPAVLVVAAVIVVAMVMIKRLDGVGQDLRSNVSDGPGPAGVLVGRLIFDRRPGQRLQGPND